MNRFTLIASCAVCVGVGYLANAGPLVPPGGPISPTYRTLDEVDGRTPIGPESTPGSATALFRITQSGSYYLTRSWTVGQNQSAIEIAARDVTIDLNGHVLNGEGFFTTQSRHGIVRQPGTPQGIVVIRDGTIRSFDLSGIELGSSEDVATIEGVRVVGCGRGIVVDSYATVRRCSVSDCVSDGFVVEGFATRPNTFVDNLAFGNGSAGFRFPPGLGSDLAIGNRSFDNTVNLVFDLADPVGLPVDVGNVTLGLCEAEDLSNFVN